MEERSRETTIILVAIVVVLVGSLIAVAITVATIVNSGEVVDDPKKSRIPTVFHNPPAEGEVTPSIEPNTPKDFNFELGIEDVYIPNDKNIDYNFRFAEGYKYDRYPDVGAFVSDETLVPVSTADSLSGINVRYINFSKIEIPKIALSSEIYQDTDYKNALSLGFWLYPGSNIEENGEKILLCERRVFGRYDDRSCWNLDALHEGNTIRIITTDGIAKIYKVLTVGIVPKDTADLFTSGDKDYLKIITSSAENGSPGGKAFRIVVVAEAEGE